METQRRVLTDDRPCLELVPPLSEEFNVYGNSSTVERAIAWAAKKRVLLVRGVPSCVHGIYMMRSCPRRSCQSKFRQLDHVNLWVDGTLGRPFLLSHPYSSEVARETVHYAEAHGLDISSDPEDGWYSGQGIPIRMSVPSDWPVWPIEAVVHSLLITQPIEWPSNDDPEDLVAQEET